MKFVIISVLLFMPFLHSGEGFGEIDPEIYRERTIDLHQRILESSASVCAFLGAGIDMGLWALIGGPAVAGGAIGFSYFTNSLEHPDTSCLGLDTGKLRSYLENHSVIVTQDAAASFEWKKTLIKSAHHSIELSGSFCAGEAFQEILSIIEQKMKEIPHFQVYLMSTPDLFVESDKIRLKSLERQFPENFHVLLTPRIFNTNMGASSGENHVKVLVADETYFVVGGSNLQESMLTTGEGHEPPRESRSVYDTLSGSHWRDMDMVGKGSGAKVLRKEFYKLWAKWAFLGQKETTLVNRYHPVPSGAWCHDFETDPRRVDNCEIKIIPASPTYAKNQIFEEYEALLEEAAKTKKEVTISNLIFCPPKNLLEKIQNLIKSGAKLTIISTNLQDHGAFGPKVTYGGNRRGFIEVLSAAQTSGNLENLSIYEYNVDDGIFHKKTWAFGDDVTIFSSANLGTKSYLYDDELTLIVRSKEVNAYMQEIIEKDKTLSKKMTPYEIASLESSIKGALGALPSELI